MFKHTRSGLLIALALLSSSLLAACGPSSSTEVPPTVASATSAATSAASAATTAASGAVAGSGSGDIRIGLMAPFTGPSATFGTAIKRGVDMALEEINGAGGINGRKIVTVERDDKADPETGINNIRDLIDKEKVLGLMGTANTAVGSKQSPIANQSKVPWIIPVTTGTIITRDTSSSPSYVFRDSMVDSEQAPFIVNFVLDNLKKSKVALLHDDSGYGTLGRDDALKAMDSRGIKPVMVESFKLNDAADNFKPLINKVKQSGADSIIMWCLGADAANVRKAMKDLGLDVPTAGSWGLSQPTFATIAGGLENGVYVPQTITVDTTNPKQKDFFDKYKKKYNTDSVGFPSGLSQAYDITQMLAIALKQPGAADSRDKLRDALENLASYDGILKNYSKPFSNQYHEALTRADFIMATWKDGKLLKVS